TNEPLIMATYECVCEKCCQHFEKVQPMSAKPLSVCPEEVCQMKRWGKGKVARNISGGAGLIFKGSGFYITDYRSEKYKEAAKKEAPPAAASGSDSKTSGGDTKPATPKADKKTGPAASSTKT